MAFLPAPQIAAAPNEPQSQGHVFANNMNEGDDGGQPVITQTMLAAPSFTQLRNVTSSTTI